MRRSLLRVGVFLAAIVVAVSVTSAQDDAGRKKAPLLQIESSLKGDDEMRLEWKFVGPSAHHVVKFEPEGLRITLPNGTPNERPNTGLSTNVHIKGDFEVSASYEILEEAGSTVPVPKATAVQLIVNIAEPPNTRAVVSRRTHAKFGTQFSTWSTMQPYKPFPAQAAKGRLRIVRTGEMLTFSRMENDEGKFTELSTDRFTANDVVDIKLACTTGGTDAKIDMRFTDLRIRALFLANANAEPVPVAPKNAAPNQAAPPAPISDGWLAAILFSGIAILLIFVAVVGVAILLLKRRPSSPTDATSPNDRFFPCSECGKSLKFKGDLSGKQFKCPHCGKKVVAPGATKMTEAT